MPRLEDRVCPACGQRSSPLARACQACKHTFVAGAQGPGDDAQAPIADTAPATGAAPPQGRIALTKPRAPLEEPAPPPSPAPAVRARPVQLVKPHTPDPALSPPPVTPSPPVVTPPPPPGRGATTPMGPHEAAIAMAGSTPAPAGRGQATSATVRDPVVSRNVPVAPIVPIAPRGGSPRRGGGSRAPLLGAFAVLAIGVAALGIWAKSSDRDEEIKPLPLPPPATTVRQDPAPTGDDTPAPDPAPTAAPDPGPTGAPTASGSASDPRASGRADGWIPPEATEATRTASLRADPDTDPLCAARESPVQIGKMLTVEFEKELREATKVTDDEESRIGLRLEKAFPRDRSIAGKWDLPADVARYGRYLQDLVTFIAKGRARKGIDYRIHLVHKPEFNAGALPGGVLMINTGALEGDEAVHDEAELVAVLGHEISHVEKRHTLAAYQYARAIFGDDADAQVAMKILTMPISSQYELEADENGLRLAIQAQYDPQGAVDLWRRHAKTERPASGGLLGEVMDSLLRSHPRAPVRACLAMKQVLWARDNASWARLYDGETNLQTHVMGPQKAY